MISPEKLNGDQTISCERCAQKFDARSVDLHYCKRSTVPVKAEARNFLQNASWEYLCSACLHDIEVLVASATGVEFPRPSELKQDLHYYTENGFCVFTAYYHVLRGSCCKSGCRHCPYGFKKQK